jgi:hypothetical protein
MNKAAFLVDGHLEQKFIQRTCSSRPVRRINCNGRNVATSAVAKRIATQCRLLGNRHYPIIVIIDREDRPETSRKISSQLLSYLKEEGIIDTIIIGVADRMIENWILADADIVNHHESCKKATPCYSEGCNGKNVLERCLDHYHETTIGVELLLNCRVSRIKENSQSFSDFFNQLPGNDCSWLKN